MFGRGAELQRSEFREAVHRAHLPGKGKLRRAGLPREARQQ